MGDTKVLIAVPTAEMARRADFYDYFNMLEKPIGSIITFSHGQSPARNRNLMIEQALEHNCSHVLFLDDDVAFESDLLNRLLARNVDIVSGLYFMRSYPHQPIAFAQYWDDGRCQHLVLEDNQEGLIEIYGTGLGCALIKTEVFKAIEKPWIRLGEIEKDHWCDDLGFYKRVREAGFKLHLDLDVKVGHMAQVTLWPTKVDGKWMTTYSTNGKGSASVPQLNLKRMESVEVGG